MSKLNTLAGGYKGGSPRVRSNNPQKPYPGETPKEIDANELANKIKMWYVDGNLTKEGAQIVLDELNKIVS
jgi:hypothetical protein